MDDERQTPSWEEEDDGRTIANMNVEGMPWYVSGDEKRSMGRDSGEHNQMTDEEMRTYRFAAVRAGLFIALVFGTVFAIFLAFCDFIWFR